LILIPHLVGAGAPYWNPNAKGLLYGLSLGHTKRDIMRAIIEGVCFEIKKSLEVFNEMGISISELRIAGGATRSKVWNQLQADIYSLPVVKTEYEETTALGAAILACIGAKVYSDPQKAVNKMVKIKTRFQPRKNLRQLYEKQYLKHKELYQTLSKSKI
jgi:xylulokinase